MANQAEGTATRPYDELAIKSHSWHKFCQRIATLSLLILLIKELHLATH